MTRKYLVAGNWKMNGTRETNAALVGAIAEGLGQCPEVEVVVCPPAVYLESVAKLIEGTRLTLGTQTLSDRDQPGAFTGEIYGGMLRECGCRYVIVGHSERRTLYGEDDALVACKFRAAQVCGLTPILCIGETLEERERGTTDAVLARQLQAVLDACGIGAFGDAVIAYEPVWAIGTGRTASPAQAQEAHAHVRGLLAGKDVKISSSIRILYGGSVKSDNATALLAQPDVDGGLIGGASLKSADFLAICRAAQAQHA